MNTPNSFKFSFCIITLMFITACQSPNASSISAAQNLTANSPINNEQEMVSYARSFIGTKYVWGGSTPKG
ncbi:hypothetical protein L4D77_28615, partial [Photobacterium frigidiphilum]